MSNTPNRKEICDIGLIGLGVMGTSLARNLASRGRKVTVFNPPLPGEEQRTQEVVEQFPEANFTKAETYEDLVSTLQKKAVVFIMVKAGAPVDAVISELKPYLQSDDIIIDGGNSHYDDTSRRVDELINSDINFVGMGVSGGEEGALKGPAMMPGGKPEAKEKILDLFVDAAAQFTDGTPCISWIGEGGAGHFAKMVHNGIEYAEMQLIAEIYDLLKRAYGLSNLQIADYFTQLNSGILESYLLEITIDILGHKEDDSSYTLDNILDIGGQKGTGRWTVDAAMRFGVAIPCLTAAVEARTISSATRLSTFDSIENNNYLEYNAEVVELINKAFYTTKIAIYDQGLELIKSASAAQEWNINLRSVLATWRAGCIIRSNMLNEMMKAVDDNIDSRLINTPMYKKTIGDNLGFLQKLAMLGLKNSIPMPVITNAANYILTLASSRLPMNMIQAQRDYFGAHTYEKTNKPRGDFFHTNWK